MDFNSSSPLPPEPLQPGSSPWLWVAAAGLAVCFAALAGAWLMLPGTSAHAEARPRLPGAATPTGRPVALSLPRSDVAQGIQAPPSLQMSQGMGLQLESGYNSGQQTRVAHGYR